MPLDPTIPLSVRPFQGVNILAIQENQRRQDQEARLAEQDAFEREKYGLARQELAEQKAGKQAISEAYQNAGGNRQELLNQLAQRGQGHLIPTVIEQFNKIDQASLNLEKTQAEIDKLRKDREDAQKEGVGRFGAIVEAMGNDQNAWSWFRDVARNSNGKWGTEEDLAPFDAAIAQDPSKVAAITGVLQRKAQPKSQTGKTREVKVWNPDTQQEELRIVADEPGQAFPVAPKAVKEAGEAKLGSAEDYMLRYAKEKGKTPDQLTTAEMAEGLRRFNTFNDRPQAASAGGGGGTNSVREAVTAMKEGTVPPQLPGRASKDYIAIMAEARRQGFNLAKAAEDWQATSRYLSTLNGAQQVRLRQAVSFTKESLPLIEDLAKQWDAGRFPLLNKANLALAKNGAMGAQAASLATKLEAQISDLTSELGTVYKGGNSSTDESLKLAAQNLQSNWSKQTMLDNISQIRKNLEIREHSMQFGSPAGVTPGSPYTPSTGAPAPSAPSVTGKVGKYTYTVK